MRDFLASILGTYTPVSYETFQIVDGEELLVNVIPNGLAGVDWLYVVTACAFLVCLWSVFRFLGGIVCRNS